MRTFLALVVVLLPFSAAGAADLVLAADTKTDYQIVVPDTAPSPAIGEALRQTARLVQTTFRANGVDAPVVTETNRDPAKPAIFLGDTTFARDQNVDLKSLKGWGYFHKVVGKNVIIAGRDHPLPDPNSKSSDRPRSWDRVATAKAAADFLRQYAGVRFLYPDVPAWTPIASAEKVDFLASPAFEFLKTPTIAVPADLDVRVTPAIEYHISYPMTGGFYDLANNRFPIVDEAIGVHTYDEAVPPAKYKDTHPEYFALVGGKRTAGQPGNAQYCISNPAVRDLILKHMVDTLDRGFVGVYLGQPDGFRPCQCDECTKLYDTGTDWNEKLWRFHRDLAERVNTERPGKRVTIMSYIQTAMPPKTFQAFPENTAILLTGTNEDDIAPWRTFGVSQGFAGYIYNWCPNLSSRYTPMRTPRYVEAQAQRLFDNKIRSIYRDGFGVLFGLEGPVYYTMGRMYDDPTKNQAKVLVSEFCEAAFGKAAVPMSQFYERLYHAVELYSEFLGTRNPAWTYHTISGQRRKYLSDPFQLLGFLYTPSVLAELETQLAAAEGAADTDKVRTRLTLVRREFDYLTAMVRVVHLYHAYQTQPDRPSRDRLLDAVDARNALIDGYYDNRGRTKPPVDGWAYTFFPPPGHNAAHLRLEMNGYQEPYANTAFNWDTKAMRTAPLPGAKKLAASSARRKVTLTSTEWDKAATAALVSVPAGTVAPTTTFRVLADATQVYVRVECTGPAKGTVSVMLAPEPGREDAFQFTVGPQPSDRQDAALGLVTDPLDPRFGKFDADWSGEWTYEVKADPAANRWVALVAVPFKTLGVEAPKPGTFWRGNVSRRHDGLAAWSVSPSAKSVDDLADFGELVFPADKSSSAAPADPLRKLREDLYAKSFDVPAEWKSLPDPLPSPVGPWTFRKDPLDVGVKQKWFAVTTSADGWLPIPVPAFWAESAEIGKYEGHGWYRTTFNVPDEWKGRPVRVLFGAADEQAWVYVNGEFVKEHTAASEKKRFEDLWDVPFAVEVPPAVVNYGGPNTLVVRLHNGLANGGLWRPVLIHAGQKAP